jgi:hypothetical protein
VAQLFSLGHLAHFWADSFEMSALRLVSPGLARAGFERRASAAALDLRAVYFADLF